MLFDAQPLYRCCHDNAVASSTTMHGIDALLTIARDLTASLATSDRYERLLEAVRGMIPCDAAALLRRDGDVLVPLAIHGLSPDVLGRRFHRQEHPRLDEVLASREPVRFPADSPLPDPFDGLLLGDASARRRVHACLGCPLVEAGEVVGVLTADAFEPHAFDRLEQPLLATLGALAGAALRTTALIETLERHAAHQESVTRALVHDADERGGGAILGTSPAIQGLRREIDHVAPSDMAVLITGETGVGKELVARALHAASRRSGSPLIYVNCAALPESIAESELFGHTRGSFTGADSERAGKFEVAHGSTLFLDEVGELPLGIQPKLLRALQEGEIQRVGSDRVARVDVRVVAATNRDLAAEVSAGRFRLDLYHRLDVVPVRVPPLRDRREDVALLAGHFADRYRRRLGLGPVRLTARAREALARSSWPGNVRELDHVIGRALLRAGALGGGQQAIVVELEHLGLDPASVECAMADDAKLGPSALAPDRPPDGSAADPGVALEPLREATERFQRAQVARAVAASGGNWAAAARVLGMHRSNLHHLAQRLGLLEPTSSKRPTSKR
jgi:anaerobic nitric oxide reductase transcription regulator